jgi:hypothetical protein
MKWIINIENRKKQRIEIKYSPIEDNIMFYGKVKTNNGIWDTYHTINYNISELDNINMLEVIENIISKLDEKVKIFELLNEQFKTIENIEIKEEE